MVSQVELFSGFLGGALKDTKKHFKLTDVYSEKATNFAKYPPYFCVQYIQTKVRWRFRKILRPFQNI